MGRAGQRRRVARDRRLTGRRLLHAVHDRHDRAGWTVVDLWLAALALGGNLDCSGIEAAIVGLSPPSRDEFDMLVLAFNERFADRGFDRPMLSWDQLPAF